MRKAAAVVSVGTYSAWESTATLHLLGGARGAGAPTGKERGGGILCRHAHSLSLLLLNVTKIITNLTPHCSGLHESHIHVTHLGRQLHSVDLRGCRSIEDLQQRVRRFAADRPAGLATWVVGHGWDQYLLGRYPTRHDVDAACSDRPVHLTRICGHASVENSLALKLAGLYVSFATYRIFCIIGKWSLKWRERERERERDCISALAVFSRNALYKSTFYLLTYLLTAPAPYTGRAKKVSP